MNDTVIIPRPAAAASLRLFCFPYAGGSSRTYTGWAPHLHAAVELVCVELPGRGIRFDEACVTDVGQLARKLRSELMPLLDRPFMLFGHSNGALVAFELARELARLGIDPALFIASAKAAPSLICEHDRLHELDDASFIEELRRNGGTPTEFFECPELLELFLPPIRADFALSGTYQHVAAAPIRSDLLLLSGSEDTCMDAGDRRAWAEEFAGDVKWQEIKGGHFFVDQVPQDVVRVVNRMASMLLATARGGGRAANASETAISHENS